MQLWIDFLDSLKDHISKEALAPWIQGITIIHFDAQNLYLEAEDPFYLNWFEEYIRPHAIKKFRNNSNKLIKIHLTVKEGSSQLNSSKKELKFQKVDSAIPFEITQLDESKNFDTFITEEGNKVVVGLLKEINPKVLNFNPIFITGPSGSGKTHLLMAACLSLKQQGYNVLYVHANLFTEQVVQAIRSSRMHEFRAIYRHIDFLAIDDIQLLAKKTATQEEFFHTFNALHIPGKPILISSNLEPQDLKEIEPRLISRFEWGISMPVKPLTSAIFISYLDSKLEELDFPLAPASKNFILKNFGKSISDINKALEALFLRSHMQNQIALTLEDISFLLKDMLIANKQNELSVDTVIETVAATFRIKAKDILGKSQTKECATPRQVSMYFLRELLELPYKKIGEIFARDHSTVMSSIKLTQERFHNRDEEIFEPIKEIKMKLGESEKEKAL